MKTIVRLIYFSFVFFLIACSTSNKKPDISKVNINFKVYRFEKDLFNIDYAHLSDSIVTLQKKYGEFFNLFSYKIIRIGNPGNPAFPNLLLSFLTDFDINKVKKAVDSTFSDFDQTVAPRIEKAFRYYKYYFPEANVPTFITYISGFNQSMVTTDTILGISLDKYLGQQSQFYQMLGLPKYMRQKMNKEYIPADCARAWALTQYPFSDTLDNSLLAHLIYHGKVIYFVKNLLPDEADSLVFGLTTEQLKWCKKFEPQMWDFIISNKHLFSSDFKLIKRYLDEAPFTKDFGQKSPGRAMIWIGYQIVSQYMKNSETTLPQLMNNDNYQQILKISKYKP